jgi:hypothetical protein
VTASHNTENHIVYLIIIYAFIKYAKMWKQEITIETKATKEPIWKLWSDVENWNK